MKHRPQRTTTKLRTTFGLMLPPWQSGVERMLAEVSDL